MTEESKEIKENRKNRENKKDPKPWSPRMESMPLFINSADYERQLGEGERPPESPEDEQQGDDGEKPPGPVIKP